MLTFNFVNLINGITRQSPHKLHLEIRNLSDKEFDGLFMLSTSLIKSRVFCANYSIVKYSEV